MKVTKTHVAIAKKIILDQAQAYRVLRHKTATKVRTIEKKANALRRGSPNLVKITELNQLTTVLLGLRSDLDCARRGVELNAECYNAEIKLLGGRYSGDLLRINDLLANRDVNPKKAKKAIPVESDFKRFAGETMVHVSKRARLLGPIHPQCRT